jgi:hypothetical protein
MDQPKFSIGPYELFSSIIAGVPLLLAGVLIYRPISGVRDLIPTIKDTSSIPVAVTFILIVYILGGLSSFATWRYFLLLCRIFKMDYSYLGTTILKKMVKINPDLDKVTDGCVYGSPNARMFEPAATAIYCLSPAR